MESKYNIINTQQNLIILNKQLNIVSEKSNTMTNEKNKKLIDNLLFQLDNTKISLLSVFQDLNKSLNR